MTKAPPTKTRSSRSKAKGTRDIPRTAEGLPLVEARYEPGLTQVGPTISGYNRFSLEEIDFLDRYAEYKADIKAIVSVTGLTRKKIDNLLMKPSIRAEIAELQEVWRLNRKMTAEHAAAKHIKLMAELEADYNAIDDPVDRAKMANPRVKASETYLRAAGHFNHGQNTQDAQVVINIDLGDSEVAVTKGGETAKVKKVDHEPSNPL